MEKFILLTAYVRKEGSSYFVILGNQSDMVFSSR